MARWIVIEFPPAPTSSADVHRIRNFGEDLSRACSADDWASIPLGEVDQATDRLRVAVRSKRRVAWTLRVVSDLLARHSLSRCARVSEVAEPG